MRGHVQQQAAAADCADALIALVRAEGTASHQHPTSEALVRGPEAARNVADIVHLLCLLHGRQPGVVDHAAIRATDLKMRSFLNAAVDAFAEERLILTRLVVSSGPMPSTTGQAETEATVLSQHHALEMLAQSDRSGCATGAALALLADWAAIRPLLNTTAQRLGLEVPRSRLPDTAGIAAVMRASETTPAIDRAMLFGAQQIVAQHRGLWDLLEARGVARSAY
ncbi:MAG: DUF6975 family protein [Sphingomonadaceae bacterium]